MALVDDNNETIGMKIFPNPSDGQFRITLRNIPEGRCQLSVVNALGQQVLSQVLEQTMSKTITLSNVEKGIYFVKLCTEEGQRVIKKLIVE